MSTVVLVHGAWHGAWCWDGVVAELEARRMPTVAVELPFTGYHDDVAAARAAMASAGEDVVVCAHSYGGMVVSQGATGLTSLRRLVFVAAFPTEDGEDMVSLLSPYPSAVLESLVIDEHGVSIDPAQAREVFYGDSSDEVATACVERLRPMAGDDLPLMVGEPAWRTIPSTYVLCSKDKTVPVDLQRRLAARVEAVVEWPTDHSPFLTRAGDLAELLSSY